MLDGLSNGERRVADLVARGLTNREVADALRLQPKTVEWTLTNVYRKLGVFSRTELAITVVRSRAPSKPEIPPADQRDLPT